MKEFEKWFEKNKPYERYSCMNMADKAWKAALEWVLSQSLKSGCVPVEEFIEEELEE